MNISTAWRNDAFSLSALLDNGQITPTELLELYLERCDRLNPAINAFIFIDRRGAIKAAEAATVRQRQGKRIGPLDGLPIAIKDNLYVAGMPASWGSLLYQDFIPDRDDICVERLRAAGAVIIGKTTTPEFALSARTESRLAGITRNPWNLDLTPGGSSGGAAAAVAAGMIPLAVATDAGGSTRLPASYTGLVGLRPSNGRIPRRYGFPPMAIDFQAIGLLTRTVRDLDMLFRAVSEPDARDPMSLSAPQRAKPPQPFRIGYFSSIGDERADEEVEASVFEVVSQLRQSGHMVEECDAPYDITEIREIWHNLTAAGAARAAIPFADTWQEMTTEQIADLVGQGLAMSATAYVETLDRLQTFRAETTQCWRYFDALITPTGAAPAWRVEDECPNSIGGQRGTLSTQTMFCGWVNAIGGAGISVPVRPHPDGRPIGMQIIGPVGGDDVVIEIAKACESFAPWLDRWPTIAHV